MQEVKYGRVISCALNGINGILIEIEVSLLAGMPHFDIVGLGDCAVRESRNRVYAAIKNSGYNFPQGRLTASYAPAWLKKEGTGFDLALALAILIASRQLKIGPDKQPVCVIGELSLTGEVKPLPGVICRVGACVSKGIEQMIVPAQNYNEAAGISSSKPYPVRSLRAAAAILARNIDQREDTANKMLLDHSKDTGHTIICNNHFYQHTSSKSVNAAEDHVYEDALLQFSSIAGQQRALRGLILSAAGWHHSLMLGSPGCGKTTLARCLPALLPDMETDEAREVTMIRSSAGLTGENDSLIKKRPFEAPHHTASRGAMIGGGNSPYPGLCTLAHQGILFLDELTHFASDVLDSLRQPLEQGVVNISRFNYRISWPADFLLVGAANPCQCGNLLEPDGKCRCSSESVSRHLNRISGPLLDRMDLTIEMTRLKTDELPNSVSRQLSIEPALIARQAVANCWQRQRERCLEHGVEPVHNGRVSGRDIADLFEISQEILQYTANASDLMNLSARGYIKALKLARTIADLENDELIKQEHINEALQYRLYRSRQ